MILAFFAVNASAFGFDISEINKTESKSEGTKSAFIERTYLKRMNLGETEAQRKFSFEFSGRSDDWTSYFGTNLFGIKQSSKLSTAYSETNDIINSDKYIKDLCSYDLKNNISIADANRTYSVTQKLECKNFNACDSTDSWGGCAVQVTLCTIKGEIVCDKNSETQHLTNEEILKNLIRNF